VLVHCATDRSELVVEHAVRVADGREQWVTHVGHLVLGV
jgi:hypothetical protein